MPEKKGMIEVCAPCLEGNHSGCEGAPWTTGAPAWRSCSCKEPHRPPVPRDRNCPHCQTPVLGWCPYCGKALCNKGGCMDEHDRICEGHRKSREPKKA